VSCKYHLYLDVAKRTGAIRLDFPDLEPWQIPETCALDVADRGGANLEEVGRCMNLTRGRIQQIEASVIVLLRGRAKSFGIPEGM
jgi:hypothetical protein